MPVGPGLLEDLPALALFARVVELESFTAAAIEAGIAKSAVSKRVQRLEGALGVRLLRRTTRKLALTSEGLRVYEHATLLVAAAVAAREAAGEATQEVRGLVRMAAGVTFSQMHLAAALVEFMEAYPEVSVELTADDRFADVVDGGFDLAIRIMRAKGGTVVARQLAKDRTVIVASPAYLEEHGTPLVPADLLRHRCAHYANLPLALEWRFRGEVIPVKPRFSCNDGLVLREAALLGHGLVITPSYMVAKDLDDGRLQVVLDDARRADVGIYAVLPDGRNLSKRARVLVDFLAKRLSDVGWRGGSAARSRSRRPPRTAPAS